MDIHKVNRRYELLTQRIRALPDSNNKKVLEKYIDWHEQQIKDGMAISSAKRSLEIAFDVADHCKNLANIKAVELEEWWNKQLTRKVNHRTGGDNKKALDRQLSDGSKQKLLSQCLKLVKFCDFLQYNKPLSLFSAASYPKPEICRFLVRQKNERKRKEEKVVSQNDIQRLIKHLLAKGDYNNRLVATLVALCNDCGLRLGEAVGVRHSDIKADEKALQIYIRESKTAQRTVLCLLAKKVLLNWVANCVTKNEPDALVFTKPNKKLVDYSLLRKKLKEALKELNISWPENTSFHNLRHLASSRFVEWPQVAKCYWMGWELPGMEAIYTKPNVSMCKKHYFKSIKDNPMLDEPLSELEAEIDREAIDSTKAMMNEMINKHLEELGLKN